MNSAELLQFESRLKGRTILVTGHTGFTGGWVCQWLKNIGAKVNGFSLPPNTTPAMFEALGLALNVPTTFGDICDFDFLYKSVEDLQPELILHLAAQPLVRRSYQDPVNTFLVNVQGTAHVLEAARLVKSVKGVLCVTTDKVYRNNEWVWPYRENDVLGGKDPYSASKSAAEMVIEGYASSFAWRSGLGPAIAIARGGNIIGGGDWSEDRLVPDFVRAVVHGGAMTLRYPEATRPWQHVLGLVQGYLMLLSGLLCDDPTPYMRAWNFGPLDNRQLSVKEVLELLSSHWVKPNIKYMENPAPESIALALDSSRACRELEWLPPWDTARAIAETANWYREYYKNPSNAALITQHQIDVWRSMLITNGQ